MQKSGKTKLKPSARRGGRYGMVLELEKDDQDRLDGLVERYQEIVGSATANKAFVLRQLIRHASLKPGWVPPVRG